MYVFHLLLGWQNTHRDTTTTIFIVDSTPGEVRILPVSQASDKASNALDPWALNRIRRILSSRLRIVALVDLDQSRAAAALQSKLESAFDAWKDCTLFSSISEAQASLTPDCVPQ